jgi:hypothetical protein
VNFPSHYLSQDVETFYAEFNKITALMGDLETLYEKKDLTNILKRNSEVIQFQTSFEKLKYLSNFKDAEQHETIFYEVYEPILKIAATSSRPFTDFKQENNETLTRLKWRWLASRVSNNNQGPVEEVKGGEDQLL